MKKKRMFLLGSSLCGVALAVAVSAEAADDVIAEAPASNSAAIAASDAAAATPKDEGAKPRGFYGGGSIGGSFFDGAGRHSRIFSRSTDDSNGDGQPDAFTVDQIDHQDNFMWNVFFGYRMADWLGAEVGWTDLGGLRAIDRQDFSNPTDTNHVNKVSPHVNGVEARLKAWVPLGTDRVSGIGGIGIYVFQSGGAIHCDGVDQSACTKGPGHFDRVPPAIDPREDSGEALTLSAGLQFKVTDNILIRTEYQHYFAVLDQGVDTVTASIVIGFYDFFGQGKAGGGEEIGGVVVE